MRHDMCLGRVVKATAGRDCGKYFAIVATDGEEYVLIADGVTRRLANPKRKKIKHLIAQPRILYSIADKLKGGAKVFDAELKSALNKSADEIGEE